MLAAHLRSTLALRLSPEAARADSMATRRKTPRSRSRTALRRRSGLPRSRSQLGGKTIIENLEPRRSTRRISSASSAPPAAARPRRCGSPPASISRRAARSTFDGQPMREPRRDIAIVFQDYGKALLPWRTAAGNVSLALEAGGMRRGRAPCPHRGIAAHRRPARPRRQISVGNVRRHAAAPADRPLPGAGAEDAADGRAVRRARRDDAAGPAGRGAVAGRRQAAPP